MEFISKEAIDKAFQMLPGTFTETKDSTTESPKYVDELGLELSFSGKGRVGTAKWLRETYRDNKELQKVLNEGAKEISQYEKNEQIKVVLTNGVKETLSDGSNYKDWLTCCSKFHKYSFNNSMLIYLQKPDATHVCGFKQWNDDFERHVKKGEKGITIYAPMVKYKTFKVPEEDASGHYIQNSDGTIKMAEKKEQYVQFRAISVFDVSQTEGKELPSICDELNGTVKDYRELITAVEEASPVPVNFVDAEELNGAKGCYVPRSGIIKIAKEMSEVQSFKTLIHEIAHAKLGHGLEDCTLTRSERELQAESVAFIVCASFGVDTSDYSFEYLASWSEGNTDKMMDLMSDIQATANVIVKDISMCRSPEIRLEYFSQVWENRSDKPLIAVYQLPDSHDCTFMGYDEMASVGYLPSVEDFELKYVVEDSKDKDLDQVFMELNADNRPNADVMRSLSVGDVVVKHVLGNDYAYMVEPLGFKRIDDFTETKQRAASR